MFKVFLTLQDKTSGRPVIMTGYASRNPELKAKEMAKMISQGGKFRAVKHRIEPLQQPRKE